MIPLSTKMRPISLEEFIGQESFLYKDSLLYTAIKNKSFKSAIFHGCPGTGKTTLARIVAKEMDANFFELNATTCGVKELKNILEQGKLSFYGLEKKVTYLYIDEFHRWNKLQQDALLKALEEGYIGFIGSTTENPYFSINNAILSRVRSIYEFKPLSEKSLSHILNNAIANKERGYGNLNIHFEKGTLEKIANYSNGDARIALDTLGFIVENLKQTHVSGTHELPNMEVTLSLVEEAIQQPFTYFDQGDSKYNLLSALQKSIRGSDPDAAIHYLARLIVAGEDVKVIGRRLLVMASEDIGMAYPQGITIVNAAVQAATLVGFPEASINLAQAVICLATCPKSNACATAINQAISHIKTRKIEDVPLHLRDSHYSGAEERGVKGYKYPFDYDNNYIKQQYLPDDLYKEGIRYYEPSTMGKERAFKEFLEQLKKEK